MSKKRVVLNLAGELSEELVTLLEQADFSIVDSEGIKEENELAYVFIKNHMGTFSKYNDSYDTLTKNIPIIALSDVSNKIDFLGYNGRGIINESFLKARAPQEIVKRLLSKKSSLKIENAYENIFQSLKTIKISSHETIGHYADLLAGDAEKKGFDTIAIRNYFVSTISYLAYLKRFKLLDLPYEVEYGESDDEFVVQIFAKATNFVYEYVNNSFENGNSAEAHKFLLKICAAVTNVFDIYFLKSSSKLVLTGVWLDRKYVKTANYYPMFTINNIESFSQIKKEWEEIKVSPQVAVDVLRTNLEEKMSEDEIPKGNLDFLLNESLWLAGYPVLLKKIVDYILEFRKRESYPKEINALSVKDIGNYLLDYPQTKIIKKLSMGDKEFILKAIVDPEIIKNIEASLAKTTDEIEKDEDVRQGYIDTMIESLQNIDADTVNEIIQSGKTVVRGGANSNDGSNDIIRVSGNFDSMDDANAVTWVREKKHENEKEVVFLSDKGHEVNEKIWNEKRDLLMQEAEKQIRRIKANGGTVSDIQNDLITLFANTLAINNEDANLLVNGVLDNAKSLFANSKMFEDLQKIVKTYSEEINELRLKEEILRKNKQIDDLAKIVDASRVEINSLKLSNQMMKKIENGSLTVGNLREEIEHANKKIHSRGLVIERLKSSSRQDSLTYEIEINNLKDKISSLIKNKTVQGDRTTEFEFQKLKEENRSYSGMMEVSNKRIVQMSEHIEELKKQAGTANHGEFLKIKESYAIAIEQLENQKNENEKLRDKFKKIEEKFSLLKEKITSEEGPKNFNNNGLSISKNIDNESNSDSTQSLTIARLEEANSFVNQRLKESSQKIKELSQKIVSLEANKGGGSGFAGTSDSSSSDLSGGGSGKDKEAPNKAVDYRIKQLEILNEKLVRSAAKTQADLMASKKEVMTLRAENGLHKNNLQAAEKKLEKYKRNG